MGRKFVVRQRQCGETWNDAAGNLYIVLGDGNVWVNPIACRYSDYDGSTEVERSNVRYLQERFENVEENYSLRDLDLCPDEIVPGAETDLLLMYGAYGGVMAWLRADNDDTQEILAMLTDYPVLDDDLMCQVFLEIEDAALADIYDDLIGDDVDLYTDTELYQAYMAAQEETGYCPQIEGGGVYYIQLDEKFERAFRNALKMEG